MEENEITIYAQDLYIKGIKHDSRYGANPTSKEALRTVVDGRCSLGGLWEYLEKFTSSVPTTVHNFQGEDITFWKFNPEDGPRVVVKRGLNKSELEKLANYLSGE